MVSLPQAILKIIASRYPLGNRALYGFLYEQNTKPSLDSLSATLSRMKRNGLLRLADRKWIITTEGKELLERGETGIKHFFPNKKLGWQKTKNTIVIFDIPENKKRYRDWLRSELIGFDFELIQKSVWLGPNLPKEFVEYLHENNLLKYIRFFRATEKDLI